VVVPTKLGDSYVYDSPHHPVVLQDYDVPPARYPASAAMQQLRNSGDCTLPHGVLEGSPASAWKKYDVPSALSAGTLNGLNVSRWGGGERFADILSRLFILRYEFMQENLEK